MNNKLSKHDNYKGANMFWKTNKNRAFQNRYNAAIKDMRDNLIRNSRTEIINGEIHLIVTDKRIKQIAEQMLFK